jgi:small subunit ribosomal protein S6
MAITSKYETVVIFKANLSEEDTNAQVEKFKTLIVDNGAVESVDVWGKRRLAYPINDENEGFYVQYNFTSGMEFPAELDRQLKISDNVLRSLIISPEKK